MGETNHPINKVMRDSIEIFMGYWQERIDRQHESMGYTKTKPLSLVMRPAKRWIRIVGEMNNGQSGVEAFIDPDNGNVLFPKSWSTPDLKNIRGNIFSSENGMEAIDPRGHVRYLR